MMVPPELGLSLDLQYFTTNQDKNQPNYSAIGTVQF
jgi:hypothetical protein